MPDTIDILTCEADKVAAAYTHELEYLDKHGFADDDGANKHHTLGRLSFSAQAAARKFSDLASKAMNAADAAYPAPAARPQRHREELAAEVAYGEHEDD